ncbi:DUF456 domain-containing protein [Halorientalis marina]|jgi:uncharacterized protein YqgC (DUF456 family)|uniref:DUF456 domain-containing protein n=1 Tax=Halorientalis marina TaxID=2931976 RepID=UPI001FF62946|nr:DUF456 domain-containing protein [Halorientalis marina]
MIDPVALAITESSALGLGFWTWVSIALAFLGVVGSAVPLIPGSLLALSGVYLHWWATGYTDPTLVPLAALTLLGLLILAIDWLGGALSAKVSGASNLTTALAGVAGFLLFFVAGPFGILFGVSGTVFLSEFRRTGDGSGSARTATYTTIAMLASTVAQVALTALLFLGHLLVVLV